MEKEMLADTLMETFKERLNALADINKGWNKKIQFCLDDINIGYVIQFKEDGTVGYVDKKSLEKGKVLPADVTVHLTVDVMDRIMKKEIHPVMALTQGLLRVEGELSALSRLLPVIT